MLRLVGPFITCLLALASTSAIAQAGATPPSASGEEAAQRTEGREQPASAPSVASELCPTLEQAAAENGLPLDFFVRVIWQESRFNAPRGQPQGRSGHSAIHATDRRLARAQQSVRCDRRAEGVGKLFARSTWPVWQSGARGCGLQRRSATGSGLALRARRLAKGDAPLRPDCHGPFGRGMVE